LNSAQSQRTDLEEASEVDIWTLAAGDSLTLPNEYTFKGKIPSLILAKRAFPDGGVSNHTSKKGKRPEQSDWQSPLVSYPSSSSRQYRS
jgi:hypothetical protein